MPGKRQRNKQRRRDAIKAAARQTFLGKGFSDSTTREIAERAGVAEGTIFLHWKNKRDLLLAIINDDLDQVAKEAFTGLSPRMPLLDLLTRIFVPRYRYWAQHPRLFAVSVYATMLARAMDEKTEETIRYDQRQRELRDGLTELIAQRQHEGLIAASLRPREVSRMFMAIYLSEFRMWVMENPLDVSQGIRHLRKSFRLAIRGIESGLGEATSEKR